ncbi:chorismate transformation enzyme, FkbO/Hyg5 family [Rhodanobacter lindaniclasticus]
MADADGLLAAPGTLAVLGFDPAAPASADPRYLQVPLASFDAPTPLELWQVDGPVSCGVAGALRWAAGGGWLFAAVELDEREHGGASATAKLAYESLHRFVAARDAQHVLRVWNYLAAINHGEGDAERYKHFCDGRAAGMGDFFAEGFPAATAIGHHGDAHRLQVYLLACDQSGQRVENPRQTSAWRYPRQYGRTPPSFARAMVLPARDALAISGTAAVVGHASAHQDDLQAQLLETFTNLDCAAVQLRHAGRVRRPLAAEGLCASRRRRAAGARLPPAAAARRARTSAARRHLTSSRTAGSRASRKDGGAACKLVPGAGRTRRWQWRRDGGATCHQARGGLLRQLSPGQSRHG